MGSKVAGWRRGGPHVVFAGGGTLGHLFPGLATAEQLRRLLPAARITFAGGGRTSERRQVARAGFHYAVIRCRPLPRSPWQLPRFLADNTAGYRAASRLLKQDVSLVVGLGGYASVPAARAAVRRGVPLVLLEQNAVPGRATRWLAAHAALVCLAFDEARSRLRAGGPVRVTGTPIRGGFTAPLRVVGDALKWPRRLIVLGGSSGAAALNDAVPKALARVRPLLDGWSVLHQAGERGVNATSQLYWELEIPAQVVPFIEDVPQALRGADLAVCRAGGTTLAELAAAAVPAVLVPYPHARDEHQLHNARALARGGGCRLIDARRAVRPLDHLLADRFSELLVDAALRRTMSAALAHVARPQAAWHVARMIAALLPHERRAAA